MIIKVLDDRLPVEIADLIYRDIHRSIQRDINIIINHKIVFVLVKERNVVSCVRESKLLFSARYILIKMV